MLEHSCWCCCHHYFSRHRFHTCAKTPLVTLCTHFSVTVLPHIENGWATQNFRSTLRDNFLNFDRWQASISWFFDNSITILKKYTLGWSNLSHDICRYQAPEYHQDILRSLGNICSAYRRPRCVNKYLKTTPKSSTLRLLALGPINNLGYLGNTFWHVSWEGLIRSQSFWICLCTYMGVCLCVTGKYFMNFEIPTDFTYLWRYMLHMYQLDAFTQSCPADQDIINHYKLQQVSIFL